MFSSEHAIWKFAFAGGEVDDWLPYAEELVQKWTVQHSNEIGFEKTFDIILAALLLEDDLLPVSARVAFSKLMLEIVAEASVSKLRIKCLYIAPPKPGRKENRREAVDRFREVRDLIQEGISAADAYRVVAEKHFKAPDTIRRQYERRVKKTRNRKAVGDNEK